MQKKAKCAVSPWSYLNLFAYSKSFFSTLLNRCFINDFQLSSIVTLLWITSFSIFDFLVKLLIEVESLEKAIITGNFRASMLRPFLYWFHYLIQLFFPK